MANYNDLTKKGVLLNGGLVCRVIRKDNGDCYVQWTNADSNREDANSWKSYECKSSGECWLYELVCATMEVLESYRGIHHNFADYEILANPNHSKLEGLKGEPREDVNAVAPLPYRYKEMFEVITNILREINDHQVLTTHLLESIDKRLMLRMVTR